MLYQALYRKYRPKTFDEVCGQKVVVKTLKNTLSSNKLTHAYLFIGPRGTGKTSIAKIFAKTINCLDINDGCSCEKCDICKLSNDNQNVDIIEMDAASNNGVDEIREIRDHVSLMPTFSKYKIYIIDEVHMLSSGAFNALLKTLEEPPSHVIFILATTEPQKVPLTIMSRCQCFEFKSIPEKLMKEKLKEICNKENINITDEALLQVCIDSNGGLRDGIGLLDQLNSFTNSNITLDDVLLLNGRINEHSINDLLNSLFDNNISKAFELSENYNDEGKNFLFICEDIIKYLKNELLSYQLNNNSSIINKIGKDNVINIIFLITEYINYIRNTKDKKIYFDLLLIKIANITTTNKCTSEEKIIPIKKEIESQKKVKIEENIEEDIIKKQEYDLFEELMNIRLNNILASADKESLNEYNSFLSNLESNLENLEERKIFNLLLDTTIKAGSKNGIIITTFSENILFELYDNLKEIENLFLNRINRNIKICFYLDNLWDKKRIIYIDKIKNKEKIDILDELDILNKINNKNVKKNHEFEDLLEIGE